MSGNGLTRAEHLELSNHVAPVVREAAAAARGRRVTVYNQQTGEVTGYTTADSALKGVLATAKLELDTSTVGGRPERTFCERCGRPIKVPRVGVIPKTCRRGCLAQPRCAGWGPTAGSCQALTPASALVPARVARRGGEPWRCKSCATARHADRLKDGRPVRSETKRQLLAEQDVRSARNAVRRVEQLVRRMLASGRPLDEVEKEIGLRSFLDSLRVSPRGRAASEWRVVELPSPPPRRGPGRPATGCVLDRGGRFSMARVRAPDGTRITIGIPAQYQHDKQAAQDYVRRVRLVPTGAAE